MIDRRDFLLSAGASSLAASLPVSAAEHEPEIIFTDAMVLTMDEQRRAFRRGFLWIKGSRIYRTGPMNELRDLPRSINRKSAKGRLLMPGLVNGHTHLSNGMLRGLYDEMPLEVWFSKGMWPVLDGLDRPNGEAAASLALLELMSLGVTTTAAGEIG